VTTPIITPTDSPDNLKRCPRCGEIKPRSEFHRNASCKDGLATWCKDCACASARMWTAENRERNRVNSQRWAAENREYKREQDRIYTESHKEEKRAYDKVYSQVNRDRKDENSRRYRETDKGKTSRRYNVLRRRARKLSAGGTFTPADIEAIRVAQGNRCYICHKPLKKYHIDHFIPLAKGGTNDPGNLRLACPKCNMGKSDKHPFELGVLL
jgi:hypothetical protein